MKSAGSKPDLRDWGHTGVQLIIHIVWPLIIIFMAHFVVTIGRMTPPSIKQEAEEEWEYKSGVKVRSVNIEDPISFERGGRVFPKPSVAREWANARNKS